jgi:hypothetical protein
MAYDPVTGKTGPHTVTAISVQIDPVVEHLRLTTGSIDTTPNHRFYTLDRGWVEAGSLVPGDRIKTESGIDALVVSFTLEATPTTMWDLTVDGAHTFYVGSGAALVHNCGENLIGPKPNKPWQAQGQRASPDIQNLDSHALNAMSRRGWTAQDILDAYKNGTRVPAYNKATLGPASRYVNSTTGMSVIVDDITGQVIMVGGQGFKYGPESGDIP